MSPARDGSAAMLRGRRDKAEQFAEAASLFVDDAGGTGELGDAYVTLAVHAGIAAADVICISRLGKYSATGSHDESADLLAKTDAKSAVHLRRLLSLKTKAGYSHSPASAADIAAARRALGALFEAMRRELAP